MQSNQKKEKMDMLHGSIWNKLIYSNTAIAKVIKDIDII